MEFSSEELKALVDGFSAKVAELSHRIDSLEKRIYEDFLAPAQENYHRWEHDEGLRTFREAHHDILEPLCDLVKKTEGNEDFDLYDKVFSDYSALETKPDETEYVASVAANITQQLQALSDALGASEVFVKKSPDGTVDIATEDGDQVKVETEEPEAEPEAKEETVTTDLENADDFESQVESALKKFDNRLIFGGK